MALLHNLFLVAILTSCYLASQTLLVVGAQEGESLQVLSAPAKLRVRIGLLLAIAFSAATANLELRVYTYVMQIKYTIFACMPAGVRLVVFAADVVAAVVCA